MLFHNRLMSPEPGAGGGAGGTPSGDMPEAWMEQIVQKMSGLFQKALTSRDAQADKKREADQLAFKKMIEEAVGARPSGGGDPPPDPGGGKGGKGGKDDKDNVALQTLQKRLDEMQQRSDLFEQKAQAERQARRKVGLVQKLMEGLGALNITGERAEAARDSLLYRSQVDYADDDSDDVIFRGADGVTTELPLGLRQWAKSPVAQIYIPPSGVNGSGSRPGGKGPTDNKALTTEQRLAMMADIFDRNMP
jgi:hypothetical protein